MLYNKALPSCVYTKEHNNIINRMTKQTLLLLCASLCLSLALPNAGLAQAIKPEIHKANTATQSNREVKPKDALLADKLEIKKKISSLRQIRDAELKRELEREALEAPSEELYGEDSWSGHVNPFAGMNVDIPDKYDINLDGFVSPLDRKHITSHYGYRASFGRMHYGTDLAVSIGDTVRAAFSGKVRIASYEGRGYGNYVVIRHPNGLETVYGHLHRRIVTEGTIVQAGEPIGLAGNTGRSTGPHLHFEARFMGIPLNPSELFDLEMGVPRFDSYAFHKQGYRRQISSNHSLARRQAATPNGKGQSIKTYRVRKGDTLSSIARQHGVSEADLRRLNGSGSLKTGRSIRIS